MQRPSVDYTTLHSQLLSQTNHRHHHLLSWRKHFTYSPVLFFIGTENKDPLLHCWAFRRTRLYNPTVDQISAIMSSYFHQVKLLLSPNGQEWLICMFGVAWASQAPELQHWVKYFVMLAGLGLVWLPSGQWPLQPSGQADLGTTFNRELERSFVSFLFLVWSDGMFSSSYLTATVLLCNVRVVSVRAWTHFLWCSLAMPGVVQLVTLIPPRWILDKLLKNSVLDM